MEPGQASKTALGVAIRRAAHQLVDQPPVLVDPIALPLIGNVFPRRLERASEFVARQFRAFMAVRSRYAEDQLALAVAQGIRQYVVLGAGLDTFAYRNPFPQLHVYEVDFPATQEWKRHMLAQANIPIPPNLTFVPVDFEHHTLADGLAEARFDASIPAFCAWLGVVPYLTLPAFRSTLSTVARMPIGSGVSFDYALDPATLSHTGRAVFNALAGRVARAGEPFQLFFTPDSMAEEFRRAGFRRFEQVDSDQLNARYFLNRADGLKLSDHSLGILTTAWV